MTSEFLVAVHAIEYLYHKNCSLSSDALAANVCTNPARVRKVLARLKKAGLVETKVGADGGYCFVGDGSTTLRQIFGATGGEIVTAGWKSGNPEMECLICAGMAGAMDKIMSDLNELCLAHLDTVTIARLDTEYLHIPWRENT